MPWQLKLALFAYRKLRSYIANKGTDADTVEHDQPAPIERPTAVDLAKAAEGVEPYFEASAEIDQSGPTIDKAFVVPGKVYGVEYEAIMLAELDIERTVYATAIEPPSGATMAYFHITNLAQLPKRLDDGSNWTMECEVVGYGDDPA